MKKPLLYLMCIAAVGALVPMVSALQTKQELSFKTLSKQTNVEHARKENLVIRKQTEWEKLWKEMHGAEAQPENSGGKLPELPQADFNRHMVLAVFQGAQPSGGYSIEITKIVRANGKLEVFVEERKPGQDCFNTQAITYPHHLVVVDKSTARVRFTAHAKTVECR